MDEASTEPYHSDSGQSFRIVNFDLEPDAMGKTMFILLYVARNDLHLRLQLMNNQIFNGG